MTLYMEATADVRLEVFGDNLCSFTKASWPTLKVGREKCAIYIYIYIIYSTKVKSNDLCFPLVGIHLLVAVCWIAPFRRLFPSLSIFLFPFF